MEDFLVHESSTNSSSETRLESDSESNEEESEKEEEGEEEEEEDHCLKDRNGRVWNRNPPRSRTLQANILSQSQGVRRAGRVQGILSCFQFFVSDEVLFIVVRETNRFAH